jgi:hypothetical protein
LVSASNTVSEVFTSTEAIAIEWRIAQNEVFTGSTGESLASALTLQEVATAFTQGTSIAVNNAQPTEAWLSADTPSILILGGFDDIQNIAGAPIATVKRFNGVTIFDIDTFNGVT